MRRLGKTYTLKRCVGRLGSKAANLGLQNVKTHIQFEDGAQRLMLEFDSDPSCDILGLFEISRRLGLYGEDTVITGEKTAIRFYRKLSPQVERQVRDAAAYVDEDFAGANDPRFQDMFDAAIPQEPEPKAALVQPRSRAQKKIISYNYHLDPVKFNKEFPKNCSKNLPSKFKNLCISFMVRQSK